MNTEVATNEDVELEPREQSFVHNFVVLRMTKGQAALHAGFKNANSGSQLLQRPHVIRAVQDLRAEIAEQFAVTRVDIIEGLFEAISYARMLGEPGNMISGWREVAKITGQYEPESGQKDLSEKQQKVLSMLEEMPEERLLELMEKDVAVIDGEYQRNEASETPETDSQGSD